MTEARVETWVQGLVVGQYALLRELARGGMGEIWLARQTGAAGFDRLVVLKRVIHSGDEGAGTLTMFLDEARIASQLHHPNIVQVFELQATGDSTFLVMEYLEGQTVSRFARRMVETVARVPPVLAASITASAARGLGYAHRRTDLEGRPLQIVHRDVSPQNLFITYDGQVKVLDFGIAYAAGRMAKTSTGVLKGKIAYMSPEQALGEGVRGAADVYALGIILFEMVTGTRYHGKIDEMSILRRLASGGPAFKPSVRTPVDAQLEAIIVRALDPVAKSRYADGQELFEALDGWLRHHPPLPDAPNLEATMASLFSVELRSRDELHRRTAAPRVDSNPSMPHVTPMKPSELPRAAAALGIGLVLVLVLGLGVAGWVGWPLGRPARFDAEGADAGVGAWAGVGDAGVFAEAPDGAPVDAGAPVAEVPDAGATKLLAEPRVERAAAGKLTLDTEPWTQVFLGKRSLGDTPLINYALPAGTHRLRLVNPEFKVDTIIEVTIRPRETTEKRLAF